MSEPKKTFRIAITGFVVIVILLVFSGWLAYDKWFKGGGHEAQREAWEQERDSILLLNASALDEVARLYGVIEDEHQQQAILDRLDALIDSDPRFRLGAYRDSTTESKLAFIIGWR